MNNLLVILHPQLESFISDKLFQGYTGPELLASLTVPDWTHSDLYRKELFHIKGNNMTLDGMCSVIDFSFGMGQVLAEALAHRIRQIVSTKERSQEIVQLEGQEKLVHEYTRLGVIANVYTYKTEQRTGHKREMVL